MTGRRAGAIVCAALIMVTATVPAAAYPRPGRTERVSVASDGTQASGGQTENPSMSPDGRYVTFTSTANNLVPGITNGVRDIFVHDRQTGVTERVSVAGDGTEANGHSFFSTISPDGRYLAFDSFASNLVEGDTNTAFDVFVHDRETGVTERVSVASDGTEANERSLFPALSADGRYVAFFSFASNLVEGDTNGAADAFVHDRVTGVTERISLASGGTEGNGDSFSRSISADGRYVAFDSFASNLVEGDTNGRRDVFVHDRETGITERVSVASDGTEGNHLSGAPSPSAMSADGRYVTFESFASNLVPGDFNGAQDIFVHDRQTRTTERVSVTPAGVEGNDHTGVVSKPSISADGRYVAFDSFAPDLVEGDTNGTRDIFVHDRETGSTQRVSVASDGAEGNGASAAPSIGAGGRYVAFQSSASNLVPGDTNFLPDAFVRDRGPAVGVGELSLLPQERRISVSGWSTFSGEVTTAPDPPDDGAPGAEAAGAELTEASVTYRPEDEDLLVRWLVTDLPEPGGGSPGVIYGLELELAGERYEVRVMWATTTGSTPPTAAYFALYRCAPDCTEQNLLSGGIGTTGDEVRVSLPLEALSAEPGSTLTALRAYTALGEAATGEVATFDDLNLPDVFLPAPAITLGIAPKGTPESGVVFETSAALIEGDFSGSLDASSLAPGEYEVWARACLGDVCGAASAPVTIEEGPGPPSPTLPPRPAPEVSVDHYFHSLSGSNNVDQVTGSATFDTTPPTADDPAIAIDVPGFQNVSGREIFDPVWHGELTQRASSLAVDFWGRTLPDQAFGFIAYTVRVSTGDEYFELRSTIDAQVPPSTNPSRVTHTFDKMVQGSEEVPLDLPTGPFTIAIRGTFTIDNAATEIRFDSVDFPSGFTTSGPATEPDPDPTEPPTPSPSPSPTPEPEATEVTFTERSHTSGQYTDETFLEARLTDSGDDPIAGEGLVFELTGEESSRHFTATTDEDGLASVTPTLEEKPGPHQLTVRYDGDEDRAPSADTTTFVVEKKDTATNLTVSGQGRNMTLRARLSHRDSPSDRVSGRAIDFYSDGELIGSDQTDDDGIATVPVPPGHRGANRTYEAVFEGDDFYAPSSDIRPGRGGGQSGETNGTTQVGRFRPGTVFPL